jgi:RHS repeat-associated protein
MAVAGTKNNVRRSHSRAGSTRVVATPHVRNTEGRRACPVASGLKPQASVLWMLTDHLGSVRDITDNEGVGIAHYSYDAFGNLTGGAEVILTRYLWTGREFEILTGLQYNRNRWYDPSMGRWVSEDPIGFGGGDSNPYQYVGNQPLTLLDPSGLWAEWVWPWDSSANRNLHDTASMWTGGFVPNQTQINAQSASGPAVGAAPNPIMLIDGILNGVRRMGYTDAADSAERLLNTTPPNDGIKYGMAPPIVLKGAPKGCPAASIAKSIKAPGKFDCTLGSLDEARAAVRQAFPDAVELPAAVPGNYPKPPAGVKQWFQVHPAEPGVNNNLPHIKYEDWTGGKKPSGGSWGHIFFPE